MAKFIYIAGVSGAGKTTLLERISKEKIGCICRSSSSYINRDHDPNFWNHFDALSFEDRRKYREMATKAISDEFRDADNIILIDGHFSCANRHSKDLEICFTQADGGLYEHLVLLDSSAQQVIKNRDNDLTLKNYSDTSYEGIKIQIEFEREAAQALAAKYNITLSTIHESDLEHRVSKVLNLLSHTNETRKYN